MARGRPSRATVYARLDRQLAELHTRLGRLPSPGESTYVWADIWHLEAHHSTALEGNTLVLREVATLLDEGRAVGAKPLKEYMEVTGYGDAASWVYREAMGAGDRTDDALITVREVRHIHHLAMSAVWQVSPQPDATDAESPGNFRRHDIHPFGEGMTPPSWRLVPAGLDAWANAVNTIPARLAGENLPELLADAHNHFERIRPFIDGNGRTCRLALNLVLVRLGYPPVVILKEQRAGYLRAMQQADKGDVGPLGEIIARGMIDNLNRFIIRVWPDPRSSSPLQPWLTRTSASSHCARPPSVGDWRHTNEAMGSGSAPRRRSTPTRGHAAPELAEPPTDSTGQAEAGSRADGVPL